MKKLFSVLIMITLLLTANSNILSNSAMTYKEGYPGADIILVNNNNISVEKEILTIDLKTDDKENKYGINFPAKVTAEYILKNNSDENFKTTMLFPVVFDVYNNFELLGKVKIKENNENIPYKIIMTNQNADLTGDYKVDKNTYSEVFDINKIIYELNNRKYTLESFDINKRYDIYELKNIISNKTDNGKGYSIILSFNIDDEKTKIIGYGFNGFGMIDGKIELSTYVSNNSGISNEIDDGVGFIVLGENTINDIQIEINYEDIKGSYQYTEREIEDKLEINQIVINDFLNTKVIPNSGINLDIFEKNMIYNQIYKEIDSVVRMNQNVITVDELLNNAFHRSNMILFEYDIEFIPNETKNIVVSYFTDATFNANKTADPLYTYVYLLNPAKSFNEFKNLDLRIYLDEEYKYIIDSSIEIDKLGEGIYGKIFDSLPENDLIFTTYSKEKITYTDKLEKFISGYLFQILIEIILPILLVSIIILIIIKKYSK